MRKPISPCLSQPRIGDNPGSDSAGTIVWRRLPLFFFATAPVNDRSVEPRRTLPAMGPQPPKHKGDVPSGVDVSVPREPMRSADGSPSMRWIQIHFCGTKTVPIHQLHLGVSRKGKTRVEHPGGEDESESKKRMPPPPRGERGLSPRMVGNAFSQE